MKMLKKLSKSCRRQVVVADLSSKFILNCSIKFKSGVLAGQSICCVLFMLLLFNFFSLLQGLVGMPSMLRPGIVLLENS